MTGLHELEQGDRISIDSEPFAGPLWRVSDVEVADVGLMEIPIVTLVSDSEGWALTHSNDADLFLMSRVDEDDEAVVGRDSVTIES